MRKEMGCVNGEKVRSDRWSLTMIVFAGALAAMVCVVSEFRFQLLSSQVHFANAVCLLSGMLLGPVAGGTAAGLGSALYDVFYGRSALDVAITFVSKFAMAWVCGALMERKGRTFKLDRTVLSAVAGALTYVALYMLKSYITGAIAGNGWGVVAAKFPASIINAAAAIVAAPVFYHAVLPALRTGGLLKKAEGSKR